mmetsp:Transcript_38891/g.62630  ORF Transcript_38891/g.62630 Transcript_38891/m.62630 type:complete len:441 (+) Transcript_38891:3-1325(+)
MVSRAGVNGMKGLRPIARGLSSLRHTENFSVWGSGLGRVALCLGVCATGVVGYSQYGLMEQRSNATGGAGILTRSYLTHSKLVPKAKTPHMCSVQNQFVPGCSEIKVFAGTANVELAKELAENLGVSLGKAKVSRFADGEVSVKIEESVRGKDVYVVQPTSAPANENVMELLLIVSALRHASAKRVTVVVPYFGYMRSLTKKLEDSSDSARSSFSSSDIARMMEVAGAQRVVAIDMFPPGQGMAEGFFQSTPIEHLRSCDFIVEDLAKKLHLADRGLKDGELVVVASYAACLTKATLFKEKLQKLLGISIDVATIIRTPPPQKKKKKQPNLEPKVDLVGNVKGKTVLIVEDILDTANTACSAIEAVRGAGSGPVLLFASHALLGSGATERLLSSNCEQLVTLNTVPVSVEKNGELPKLETLSVAPTVADLIKRMHYEEKH